MLFVQVVISVLCLFLLSGCYHGRTASEEGYRQGYIQAYNNSAKRQHWILQQRSDISQNQGRMAYYTIPAATHAIDGRMLADHNVTIPVLE